MGCVLNFTANDYSQLSKSLNAVRNNEYLDKSQRDQIRDQLQKSSRYKLITILEKPDSPAYKGVAQLLIGTMFSKMTDREKEKLPMAFCTVLKQTPNAIGLFTKAPSHRGPGSSPLQHHYEILATACLIDRYYKSKSGKSLYIAPYDRVDFGLKFSQRYTEPRQFGTIEADMLVTRGYPFDIPKTVAIDAKYSQIGRYSNKPEKRQLDGIRTGLRDGKIQEFFFVTNGEFTPGFKEAVEKENLLIARDFARQSSRIYSDLPKECLTDKELQNYPMGKVASSFFSAHTDELANFISEYRIPQIEVCEYVKYPGT